MKRPALILLFWFCGMLHASGLEVISLKHQSAAEVIPLIKPLLGKDEVVTGTGYKLILRASPQRLAEIESLLAQIDVAVQQLIVRVRQQRDIARHENSRSVAGNIGDDARIKFGRPVRQPGLSVQYRDGDDRLQASMVDHQGSSWDNIDQQVRTLSGRPAYISTGQSSPLPQYQTYVQGNRIYQSATTTYQDSASGFYVIPRLQGQRVQVEIRTQRDTPGQHRFQIETSSLVTTVSGNLDEWISLGASNESGSGTSSGMFHRQGKTLNDLRDISIMITVAH